MCDSASQCVALAAQCHMHMQCVAVRCSALQCVAVCCSALQCVAARCSVLQCVVLLYGGMCITHVGIVCAQLFCAHTIPLYMHHDYRADF